MAGPCRSIEHVKHPVIPIEEGAAERIVANRCRVAETEEAS